MTPLVDMRLTNSISLIDSNRSNSGCPEYGSSVHSILSYILGIGGMSGVLTTKSSFYGDGLIYLFNWLGGMGRQRKLQGMMMEHDIGFSNMYFFLKY